MINFKHLTIVLGHYGCGKTNLSLNIALDLASRGKSVTIADLDVVNPYFRTGDYKELLQEKGIKVVAPVFVSTNLDNPSLPASMDTIFENSDDYVVVDVGGDDVGAYALGRYSKKINAHPDKDIFYVVNKFRSLTSTPSECAEILYEIESAARVKATAVVNNSHLQHLTTTEDILSSVDFAKETAKILNLPLAFTTAKPEVFSELNLDSLYRVKQIVKPPF
ncbi:MULTISPECIES: cobalamin biosynthesis protein CobQ [unclassified Ruminococcus]|uniref:nucleotide-binding protein n=1 Tax=unclassified Ruminococcus TaxID=2608920 RepID=UPI00210F0FA8|nr:MULTISPECIES: cobalamin biosynthesis protein CobQ [unclassified Ruminococcus]MCQ4022581.1 ParA family protein [Ruminococcus sp. zg-924]MCQ4114821.1 ParA family protein [Ruminococcus sp. zg-921]